VGGIAIPTGFIIRILVLTTGTSTIRIPTFIILMCITGHTGIGERPALSGGF